MSFFSPHHCQACLSPVFNLCYPSTIELELLYAFLLRFWVVLIGLGLAALLMLGLAFLSIFLLASAIPKKPLASFVPFLLAFAFLGSLFWLLQELPSTLLLVCLVWLLLASTVSEKPPGSPVPFLFTFAFLEKPGGLVLLLQELAFALLLVSLVWLLLASAVPKEPPGGFVPLLHAFSFLEEPGKLVLFL